MNQQQVRTYKGGTNMQQRRFGRVFMSLVAIVALIVPLAILGCDGDGGLSADDLAEQTFVFDAVVLDPALAGATATLVFGAATGNTLPFTLTVDGTIVTGTATVGSLRLVFLVIVQGGTVNTFTFVVNNEFNLDTDKSQSGTQITIIFINRDTGAQASFTITEGETGTSSGTVTTGGGTVSQ